jgi:heptose-I-phosphate ethanolaminephosphotransferase
MFRNVKSLLRSKGYWLNTGFLLYPFFITASLASVSEYSGVFLAALVKSTIFNTALFCAGLTALAVIGHNRVKKNILRLIYFLQFLLLFFSLYHFSLYHQIVGLPSIYPLIDTNFHESIEFLDANFSTNYLLASLALASPMFFLAIRPIDLWHFNCDRLCKLVPTVTFIGIATLALSNFKPYLIEYNPLFYISKSAWAAVEEKSRLGTLYARMPTVKADEVKNDDVEMTHVLVIGEALNRNHMSLYGYQRDTTPRLRALASQLYLLRNACSSRNTTIPALQEMLTFASREDHANLYQAPNLLQIMKAAGFETYWISNQQEIGVYDSFVSIFSKSADHKLFVDHRGWSEGISLDQKLFAPLNEILKNGVRKKFIVVHLIGSHARYDLRYPSAYALFKGPVEKELLAKTHIKSAAAMQKFNEYDNSVLYNDYVTSQLVKMMDNRVPMTLTYIADHGEAIGEKGEFFGHAENLPYLSINQIPVFFWISAPLQTVLHPKIENLVHNLDAPFQSDQTIHTLLDLYAVRYPLLNERYSLLNAGFTQKSRYCDSLPRGLL